MSDYITLLEKRNEELEKLLYGSYWQLQWEKNKCAQLLVCNTTYNGRVHTQFFTNKKLLFASICKTITNETILKQDASIISCQCYSVSKNTGSRQIWAMNIIKKSETQWLINDINIRGNTSLTQHTITDDILEKYKLDYL